MHDDGDCDSLLRDKLYAVNNACKKDLNCVDSDSF